MGLEKKESFSKNITDFLRRHELLEVILSQSLFQPVGKICRSQGGMCLLIK